MIETTFLVIGAGPAGAALAAFLASHGDNEGAGIVVAAARGTAKEPRAHITNPAALECLRDIGLEAEALAHATVGECLQHYRWGHDMAGEEFARVHAWGHRPQQMGAYEAASPCRHVDLPQTQLEPILVRRAVARGWTVRFESVFEKFRKIEVMEEGEGDSGKVRIVSTIRDSFTGRSYQILSKYLFGCDGARSQVMQQLDLPLIKAPGQGVAFNVLIEADLSRHVKYRNGNLHWCLTPEIEHPTWGWAGLVRMVKAWHEWMVIILPQPGCDDLDARPSHEEYLARIRQFIGDDSIAVRILDVSKWYINEVVAERYHKGRDIFCLGDAVHRHPPFNGLGSNTCIQDAWNLAWKLSFVERGLADPSLLDSFSAERQPIGAGVIQRANQGLRDHNPVFEALGMLPADVEERKRQHAELSAPTDAGRARRKRLREGVDYIVHETSGIGIEMNQRYRSAAIYLHDEKGEQAAPPPDPVLEYQISTYPGSRLPHIWLNTRVPTQARISTIDLAGHNSFCLLTGVGGGDRWKTAAAKCTQEDGVPINVYTIGWKQDWEDVYGDWERVREVEEDGCVLVRPDRTICWRSKVLAEDCEGVLRRVLRSVLGRG